MADYAVHAMLPRVPSPCLWRRRLVRLALLGMVASAMAAASPAIAADAIPAPLAAGHEGLVRALADYEATARSEPWPVVPAGSALRPGDSSPGVAVLAARLASEGYAAANSGPSDSDGRLVFGKEFEAAVRAFQRRHGLAEDGVAGDRTLAALNVPAALRAAQTRLNIERVEALPPALGDPHIVVNIADQRLQLIAAGVVVLSSRVVVGKLATPTPVLASAIRSIVLNPTWSVPPSIAMGEILPKLRRDPSYLEHENIVIRGRENDPHGLGIDWRKARRADYAARLLQLPGAGNALGRIKFDFPNPHQVYLHDTPAKQLFGQRSWAFSHGCMRLQNPQRLAELLLASQGWPPERIDLAIAAGKTQGIPLATPVPLWVVYLTVFPDLSGAIHFRDDIYGWDGEGRVFRPAAGEPAAGSAGSCRQAAVG